MSKVVEKFLRYVSFDTKSDEFAKQFPSTNGQKILGNELVKELESMGLQSVSMDENGYVMGKLPSNMDKKVPTVGFISHMDTSPDMSGKDVKPNIIKNYDGKDIKLNENLYLNVEDFPEIKNYIGNTIITTDGTTLLGADDKAGIAEIMEAINYLKKNPQIKHGDICVAFTPDEEIGKGADRFNVEKFNADFAYTIDGGALGELEYENFNAATATVVIKGRNVHPGSAKNKMINSMIIASEFINNMPENDVPEKTEGYEGFYHLTSMKGDVEETILIYIIRDFFKDSFEKRKLVMEQIKNKLNEKYGKEIISLNISDSYYNMREKIEPVKHIVDMAEQAMKEVKVTPKIVPIRGGTDGARLSFMGLPTPNIFTGGHNFHGKYEYISVESMEKAVEVILKIVELTTKLI